MENKNIKAFLDVIAFSEGTYGQGDNGYNVIVGHTPAKPKLFHDYSDHPREKVWIGKINDYSTAAGRYQILKKYYDFYKRSLDLPDFGHDSQDKIAIRMIRECGALADIEKGLFEAAIHKCKSRWASFPGAGYKQKENKMSDLEKKFVEFGGKIGGKNGQ